MYRLIDPKETVQPYADDLECFGNVRIEDSIDYVIKEQVNATKENEKGQDSDDAVEYLGKKEYQMTLTEAISNLKGLETFYEQQGLLVEAGNAAKMLRKLFSMRNNSLVQRSITP